MNARYLTLVVLTLIVSLGPGCTSKKEKEPSSGSQLCVGACQTPEQGKAQLQRFASSYHNVKEWEARVARIRKGFIHGAGLDSIPERYWERPFNAVINHKHVMDGYTVENIAIEGLPGHYITGNLYKPTKFQGQIPAILCPHGHWYSPGEYGRFRPDMQKRCAAFARMGAVVFAYDMIGYGECTTYRHDDPEALKIQTFNSKRITDYLCSLDCVDTSRIGVTGASGGGTQTIYLTVVDPRIKVSVPVVMVSAYFYGGCICESGMPVARSATHETNLADMAALFAPKPLLIVSDGKDWTRFVPKTEYPYIRNVYTLYHAEENVGNAHFPKEGHDYGYSKRKAVYPFMARHLGLDLNRILNDSGKIDESFVTPLAIQELKVFPDKPVAFLCGNVQYSPSSPLYDKKRGK
ncbi:MAG: acetylxylan esterase [Bacteroidales bacterium]|nr:acetylxylan esterase [Bacteroidales bacterium]